MKQVENFLMQRPLGSVMLVAALLRLFAAFFAPGYLMVDDHFLVVEAGASWADGADYNNWLPWNQDGDPKPHAANFAYVGTQFFVFKALNALGFVDPQWKMVAVRLLHGIYSLLTVYLAFLITRRLSSTRNAMYVGLILGAAAIMPNFSVRQLVEFVCIPPLLIATWALVKDDKLGWKNYIIAGLGIGLSTGFRYQCGVFGVGVGLALLLQRDIKGAVQTGVWSLLFFTLSQLQDLFIWGEPFTQLRAYISYNESHAGSYPNGPWYMYLLTILGYLVPPLSVFLLFGFFAGVRKYTMLVLPALLFLVFHSIFPNKQERFIFPILPFVTMAGVMVWGEWMSRSDFWTTRRQLWRVILVITLTLNVIGLSLLTFTYAKKSRVESMYFLYQQGDYANFNAVFIDSEQLPPLFYTGSWEKNYWHIPGQTDIMSQRDDICRLASVREIPNYVLFYGSTAVEQQVQAFDQVYGGIDFQATIEPGVLDRILHWMNPTHNTLEVVHIYKAYPDRICR